MAFRQRPNGQNKVCFSSSGRKTRAPIWSLTYVGRKVQNPIWKGGLSGACILLRPPACWQQLKGFPLKQSCPCSLCFWCASGKASSKTGKACGQALSNVGGAGRADIVHLLKPWNWHTALMSKYCWKDKRRPWSVCTYHSVCVFSLVLFSCGERNTRQATAVN